MNNVIRVSPLCVDTVVRPNLNRPGAWLVVLVLAVLPLAACGDNSTNTKAGSTTSAPSDTTTTTAKPTAAGPVTTASNPTLGQILVDDKGRTLYVFDADQSGTIASGTTCAPAWPPLVLESGAALPTSGTLSADLTTVARPDGAQQVAYKGRPLYRFANDAQPGDAKGDGLGNVWHVVKV